MTTLEAVVWGLMGVWVLFIAISFIADEAHWNKINPHNKTHIAALPAFGFFIMGGFLILASIGNLIK